MNAFVACCEPGERTDVGCPLGLMADDSAVVVVVVLVVLVVCPVFFFVFFVSSVCGSRLRLAVGPPPLFS